MEWYTYLLDNGSQRPHQLVLLLLIAPAIIPGGAVPSPSNYCRSWL